MVVIRRPQLLLLSLFGICAQQTLAQQLYKRPAKLSDDCLPSSPQATTFSSVFPKDFFLSGDSSTKTGDATTVTVAKNFQVKYFPTYKEVTNTAVNETYILYQCGGTPPSGSITAGKRVFSIPLSSVMVPDTVPYAFLRILNVTDRVQSVSPLSVSPCAQQDLSCKKIAVDPSMLNNKTVLSSDVRPLVDGVTATAPMDPPPPLTAPVFTFSASQDPGTLNRAEWIKFMGLFFNKEKAASDHFDTSVKQYNAIKAKRKKAGKKPVVAWITHYVYAPDEYYQISFAPYKLQYTQDAGGENLVQADLAKVKGVTLDAFSNTTLDFAWNGTQKGFVDQAQARAGFVKALSEVDVIVDETYAIDPTSYGPTNFTSEFGFTPAQQTLVPALKGSAPQVLRVDGVVSPTGGLDWYEGAIARPAEVLADMANALAAPSSKTRKFTWLRNIQQPSLVVTDAQCTTKSSCTVTPEPLCPLVKECPDGTIVSLKPTGTCQYQKCGEPAAGDTSQGAAAEGPSAYASKPSPSSATASSALDVAAAVVVSTLLMTLA